jgi:hypothetical protein
MIVFAASSHNIPPKLRLFSSRTFIDIVLCITPILFDQHLCAQSRTSACLSKAQRFGVNLSCRCLIFAPPEFPLGVDSSLLDRAEWAGTKRLI